MNIMGDNRLIYIQYIKTPGPIFLHSRIIYSKGYFSLKGFSVRVFSFQVGRVCVKTFNYDVTVTVSA